MTGPLSGRTVVVTRDEEPDGPLGQTLAALGARVRRVPCVRAAPPEDPETLDHELARGAEYDWLFVTSARAARAVAGPCGRTGSPRVAAVGQGTARALREAGCHVDVVSEGGAEALVAAMAASAPLHDARVLFPASDRARPQGPRALEAAGAHVTKVVAYRILVRAGAREELRALAVDPTIHALTFTSPSAADALGPALRPEDVRCRIAAIGRTTAAALQALGWTELVVPPRPDFDSLARSLAEAFHVEE